MWRLLLLLTLACSSEPPSDNDMDSRFRSARWGPKAAPARPTHAILPFGQSNAEGFGISSPAVTQPDTISFYTWFHGGHQSTELESLGPLDGTHGLELTLGPMVRDSGARVAIYKHARGGARISFFQEGNAVWEALEARIPIVTGLLQERYHAPVVWHIVPFIGEADAGDEPPDGTAYAAAMRDVIARLRAPELCGPSARVYIIGVNPGFPLPPGGIASINAAEIDVAGDAGNERIGTSDIAVPGIHYNSTGHGILGPRLGGRVLAGL